MDTNLFQLASFAATMLLSGLLPLAASKLLAARDAKPKLIKISPYECAESPIGGGRPPYRMQYFSYAIYFTIFDVVLGFLIVFTSAFSGLALRNMIYFLAFFTIISLALVYSWRSLGRLMPF